MISTSHPYSMEIMIKRLALVYQSLDSVDIEARLLLHGAILG